MNASNKALHHAAHQPPPVTADIHALARDGKFL